MTKKVNELLTAQTSTEYFEVCVEISKVLERYSAIADDVFFQMNNNGLIDIIMNNSSIDFIIEGINKSIEDVKNFLKWINSDNSIKVTKDNSTDNIIIKVVL